jgi:ATP-dependent Lon protease
VTKVFQRIHSKKVVGLFKVKSNHRNIKVSEIRKEHLEEVGVLARIIKGKIENQPLTLLVFTDERGKSFAMFAGIRRIKILETVQSDRLALKIEEIKDTPFDKNDHILKAQNMEIMSMVRELSSISPMHRDQLLSFIDFIDLTNPNDVANVSVMLTAIDVNVLQDFLSTIDLNERMKKALYIVKTELETVKTNMKIHKNLDDKLQATQRNYMLNEQMKIIKKELGMEVDDKSSLFKKFNERLRDKTLPQAVMSVYDEEMSKLKSLDQSSAEFNVTRNYLDWITLLPWGIYQKENFNIKKSEKILDEDHFGLKKLKERILEFIAIGSLKGSVQGKMILLVGPPGTGKTSIGKSIARSLGREFFRFSVGGMSDVAEIKGHRRTYIGAMPGKIIQLLKLSKFQNPVIMIDEIDKLGKGHGDPASALLEVLDPEQNSNFLDHYLDVPFDLSKVLFVCTANLAETIPKPLLDRMEVLTLSGYIQEEKFEIAKRYLIPKTIKQTGLKESQFQLSDHILNKLIREYCREAGVRNLEKKIESIGRKIALALAKKEKIKKINDEELEKMIGLPIFTSDRYYEKTPIGVVMGLAYTEMGGSLIHLESMVNPDVDGTPFIVTGKLGDVMKESTTIAMTVAKNFLKTIDDKNLFFFENSIHLHLPEGATPKDGPSAGVTIVTSLLSLALNKPIEKNISMTGEITLSGKVLEVGGIKEKVIGAKRAGVTEIILPIDNKKNWNELEKEITNDLKVHFVDYYQEIYEIVFK